MRSLPAEVDMAQQILFVQGGGARTHDEWDSKLVESLENALGDGYAIRYPRMPDEDNPSYVAWKPAIEQELDRLQDEAIVIGHSLGGTMLVHVLADSPRVSLRAMFLLAAPFIGEGGWPSAEIKPDRHIGASLPSSLPVYLYHGDADATAPVEHLDLYATAIPQAVARRLTGRDHQLCNDLREVAADIKALR